MARELDDEDLGRQVSASWVETKERNLVLDLGDMADLLGVKPVTLLNCLDRGDWPKLSIKAKGRLSGHNDVDNDSDEWEMSSFDEL